MLYLIERAFAGSWLNQAREEYSKSHERNDGILVTDGERVRMLSLDGLIPFINKGEVCFRGGMANSSRAPYQKKVLMNRYVFDGFTGKLRTHDDSIWKLMTDLGAYVKEREDIDYNTYINKIRSMINMRKLSGERVPQLICDNGIQLDWVKMGDTLYVSLPDELEAIKWRKDNTSALYSIVRDYRCNNVSFVGGKKLKILENFLGWIDPGTFYISFEDTKLDFKLLRPESSVKISGLLIGSYSCSIIDISHIDVEAYDYSYLGSFTNTRCLGVVTGCKGLISMCVRYGVNCYYTGKL